MSSVLPEVSLEWIGPNDTLVWLHGRMVIESIVLVNSMFAAVSLYKRDLFPLQSSQVPEVASFLPYQKGKIQEWFEKN